MTLADLESHASTEAVEFARAILEQDVNDRMWADQVGPALAQRDVARLLAKTEQAVSKDPRLIRLRNRDGRPVYPLCQFDGRSVVTGVGEVAVILAQAATPAAALAWLTGTHPALGARPVDVLRAGGVAAVVEAAQRYVALH